MSQNSNDKKQEPAPKPKIDKAELAALKQEKDQALKSQKIIRK